MVAPIPWFRTLCRLLMDADVNANVYRNILLPWQPQALEAMSVLRAYGNIEAMSWRHDHDQSDPCRRGSDQSDFSCLEHLYALSRISDVLLWSQQKQWDYLNPPLWHWTPESVEQYFSWMRRVGIPRWAPSISLEERNDWWHSLGMTEISQVTFHPFYHEIVEVEQASDPDEPISLIETLWPGFMLGQMMFCRAGVRVRGGTHFVDKDLAEHSRLYWAFVRNNRPAVDLSHGWGSNSQWANNFRRDYTDEDAFYYNVGGKIDIHEAGYYYDDYGQIDLEDDPADPYLSVPARIELLTNRCFIVTPERSDEEFLYDVTYREPRR